MYNINLRSSKLSNVAKNTPVPLNSLLQEEGDLSLFIDGHAVSCQVLNFHFMCAIFRWACTGPQLRIWTRTCGLVQVPPEDGLPIPSR
jgi:hypothetical protein